MIKYVRVMDGLKSNAGGFDYKLDEVNVSDKWDTTTLEPEQMGGFNFGTDDKILRWLHRGDTIYDVVIPDGAEVILCDEEKGIYRSNKIIVTNPRIITDELVMELYNKTTLSDKIIAQCLTTLLWKDRLEICKYIIKDRVNLENINNIITEYEKYVGNGNFSYDKLREKSKIIYNNLKEIQSSLDISLYVSKEPYEKILSNDKVINLTGQSGSGKTYYVNNNFNTDKYVIIDADDIFFEKRFLNAKGINKELGQLFRNKYETLPNLSDDFDLIYNEILEYCKNIDKTLVIDCAQIYQVKDINILKGKIIVLRTDIDTCYNRCIDRFKINNPKANEEEIKIYSEKKKLIYKWYKYTNDFIRKIDLI